ncbi:amino acid ABC transporter permease [Microaerobacter geothermalis]|uniref:amino acid ABC transporter permease n=1 Tax=Microaerobacter geothermalis TaxID=674972 RepID=UPI001F3C2CF2|nr:amino acid ABC transporter permease [Microaerobacter geothermalis]MCF6093865.1 amino acid ABC transporter permease [Microaerobacter geothermalis]
MSSSPIDVLIQSVPLLMKGLLHTILIAVYSLVISTVGGVVFGVIRTIRVKWVRFISRTYVEIFRAIPVLVTMFFFFFGLPIFFGMDVPSKVAAVTALSLWGIAEIGEIARGALQSLPKGQEEAGKSLGMTMRQIYQYILVPQAVRRMIPPTMNMYTRIIKTTSISVLIGVTEVMKVGQDITQRTGQPIIIYGMILVFYFLLCYPLSEWSRRLEVKRTY